MEKGMKKRDVPKFRGDKRQISRTKRDAEKDRGNCIFYHRHQREEDMLLPNWEICGIEKNFGASWACGLVGFLELRGFVGACEYFEIQPFLFAGISI